MDQRLQFYRREFPALIALAWPVVASELGWMTMGIADTIMVGSLGPLAIGGVGVGHALFDAIGLFGIGLLAGLDTRISQAFGAGEREECTRWLEAGLVLALVSGLVLSILSWFSTPLLGALGIRDTVSGLAAPYARVLALSLAPLLLFSGLRRYLQATNRPEPVLHAIVAANVCNIAGNWLLIPRMGVIGSAWSTLGARVAMAVYLLVVSGLLPHWNAGRLQLWSRCVNLFRLGWPAAVQITVEVAAFAGATLLAGKLTAEELAAHQITLLLASTTFMVPLGISMAGAVRVGQAVGAGELVAARRRGWTAIGLAAGVMAVSGIILIAFPHGILGFFTQDGGVHRIGARLLALAALFQLFDGLQVSATGVLRGAGDTVTAMYANGAAYWVIGLPLGYWLCFGRGWGIEGVWMGLCLGLVLVGTTLTIVWRRRRLSPE